MNNCILATVGHLLNSRPYIGNQVFQVIRCFRWSSNIRHLFSGDPAAVEQLPVCISSASNLGLAVLIQSHLEALLSSHGTVNSITASYYEVFDRISVRFIICLVVAIFVCQSNLCIPRSWFDMHLCLYLLFLSPYSMQLILGDHDVRVFEGTEQLMKIENIIWHPKQVLFFSQQQILEQICYSLWYKEITEM